MILRNTQTILPISDFHQFLENLPKDKQKKIFGNLNFIDFIQEKHIFFKKLNPIGGSGLFRIANCMNHSCIPNCIISSCFNDSRIKIIAIKKIKKGEELTFSYIDENQTFENRQQQLLKYYYFHCLCEKCIKKE